VIADDLDLSFFATKEAAESYMEAIDVSNGVYVGYDSEGRILNIRPKGQNSEIEVAEESPSHTEELCTLLSRWLDAIGKPADLRDLRSLLEIADELSK
jgi:hypothetical protein